VQVIALAPGRCGARLGVHHPVVDVQRKPNAEVSLSFPRTRHERSSVVNAFVIQHGTRPFR